MSLLPAQPDCCTPCEVPVVANIPGSPGEPGAPGAAGVNGRNSFTSLTASFVMPAVGANETVAVLDSTWGITLQNVFVEFAGHMQVVSRPDPTHLVLKNLGYTGNAAPTTVIPNGSFVSPSGIKGVDGAFAGTLNSLSPTTTRGDMLVDNHANNPLASLVRYPVGANGTRSMADSTQPVGQRWAKVDLSDATQVDGKLSATGVLDFPSIAATGGTQDLTIALVGAVVGDAVFLGLPAAPMAGVIFQAWVSAADVVTVRATNVTAGALDPASATYRVNIIK